MLAAQGEALEMALWSAVRALRERAALYRRIAERAPSARDVSSQALAAEEAAAFEHEATLIQDMVLRQTRAEATTSPR